MRRRGTGPGDGQGLGRRIGCRHRTRPRGEHRGPLARPAGQFHYVLADGKVGGDRQQVLEVLSFRVGPVVLGRATR